MEKRIILTPVDFTEVSEFAIDHAIHIAMSVDAKVILLHIVKEASEMKKAKQMLQVHIDEQKDKYPSLDIEGVIRIGDIYSDITNAATENNVQIIVMGTHGLQGFQFITGSRALKVVSDSDIPFLIVQKGASNFTGYKKILVPLSLEKDSKQILSYVKSVANIFESKAYITVPKEKDEFLLNKLKRDLTYSEQFFKEAGIDFEAHQLEKKNDVNSYIDFASKHAIDLFVIMNHDDALLPIISNNVQDIITNKLRIPTLLINPKSTSNISIFGNYSGGG